MEPTTNNNMKQGLLGGLAIVLIGTLAFFLAKNQDTSTQQAQTPINPNNTGGVSTNQNQGTMAAGQTKTLYKDGMYIAEGAYTSPGGAEKITISITLANDVVTSATFTGKGSNPVSEKLQSAFNSGYSAQVVGKSIDSLNLAVVNGASLTTRSFNQTIETIKNQARN